MKTNSVRFKISILYTGVLGLILIIYSLFLYLNLGYVVYREIDASLLQKSAEIEGVINLYAKAFDAKKEFAAIPVKRTLRLDESENEAFQWPSVRKIDIDWRYKTQVLGIKHDFIVVYSPDRQIVEQSNNIDDPILAVLKSNLRMSLKPKANFVDYTSKDLQLRIINSPVFQNEALAYIIQIATPTETFHIILKNKLRLILNTIPIFLIFAGFLGIFFVKGVLAPVKEIIDTAQRISHKDMKMRISGYQADEEIKALVDAFNDMIERLEKSFRHIEEFSSDVAHELKTPLAIIRGELELSLRKERSPEEYKKAIKISLEELERVLKTINDLLLLAKLDYQTEKLAFEPLELGDFLKEVSEQSKVITEPKKISLEFNPASSPLTIRANALHLRRLFFNLIDNAVKFTPPEGKIAITLENNDTQALISISDSGIGIPEENLPRIFSRFFHVDYSRSAPAGNGLGLSIVDSIVRIHNGKVTVKSAPGAGTTFTIILPLIPSG